MVEPLSITNEAIAFCSALRRAVESLKGRWEATKNNPENLHRLESNVDDLKEWLELLHEQYPDIAPSLSTVAQSSWKKEIAWISKQVKEIKDDLMLTLSVFPNPIVLTFLQKSKRNMEKITRANRVAEGIARSVMLTGKLREQIFERIERLEGYRHQSLSLSPPSQTGSGPAAHSSATVQPVSSGPGAQQLSSTSSRSTSTLTSGKATSTTSPPSPSVTPGTTYTTLPGDSLWDLALRFCNNPACYLGIYEANRNVILNPDFLPIGKTIIIPSSITYNEPQSARTHVVQQSETLSSIAAHYYNDPQKYIDIYNTNRSFLTSPNMVHPGQRLIIPKSDSLMHD